MVDLNIRLQLAGILILLTVAIDFFKAPHLKVLSTRFFIALLGVSFANLFFDVVTVYTVNNMQSLSDGINRLCHQFFIGSLVVVLFMLYMYMVILAREQRRINRRCQVLSVVPLLISAVMVVFGRLDYIQTPHGAYSYGPMAFAVYFCGFLYLAAVGRIAANKRNILTDNQRVSVWLALGVWLVGLAVQIIVPSLLVSGLALSLLVLLIYMSFENQRSNLDSEVGGFNRSAYLQMYSEFFEKPGALTVINVVFENYGRMGSLLGVESSDEAMGFIRRKTEKALGLPVYHSRGNMFTVFIRRPLLPDDEALMTLQSELSDCHFDGYSLHIHADIIDVRKYAASKKDIYDLSEFLAREHYSHSYKAVFMSGEILKNKHRLERIEHLLEHAIGDDGFSVVYQPIYSPEKGRFTSAEALVRMPEDKELGYISPEEFIPLAESKGLIVQIGEIVLDKVAAFIKREKLQERGIEYVEVNLSGIQVTMKDISERLLVILNKYGIPASYINLEITETAIINSSSRLVENMQRLRESGFCFSMDDFGTGYSNLAQMSKAHYDLIKVDKSILWPAFGLKTEQTVEEQAKAQRLLKNVLSMLHDLPTEIVVEGVETKEMADYLSQQGVAHLQGFYFARPLSEESFLAACTAER